MRYHGEPFLWPTTHRIEGANVELWGTYNAEATLRGRLKKKKRIFGAAAIVGGTYGKGRRGQVGPAGAATSTSGDAVVKAVRKLAR